MHPLSSLFLCGIMYDIIQTPKRIVYFRTFCFRFLKFVVIFLFGSCVRAGVICNNNLFLMSDVKNAVQGIKRLFITTACFKTIWGTICKISTSCTRLLFQTSTRTNLTSIFRVPNVFFNECFN